MEVILRTIMSRTTMMSTTRHRIDVLAGRGHSWDFVLVSLTFRLDLDFATHFLCNLPF